MDIDTEGQQEHGEPRHGHKENKPENKTTTPTEQLEEETHKQTTHLQAKEPRQTKSQPAREKARQGRGREQEGWRGKVKVEEWGVVGGGEGVR